MARKQQKDSILEIGATVDRIIKTVGREFRGADNRAEIKACISLLRIFGRVKRDGRVKFILSEADLKHVIGELLKLSLESRPAGAPPRWSDGRM